MSESETTGREERAIRELLNKAGPRPPVPEADLTGITEAARAAWRRRYGHRKAAARARQWWAGLAAAAVLAVALGLVFWRMTSGPPPAEPLSIASIEMLTGTVRVRGPAGLVPLAPGQPLPAGSELETGGGTGGTGRLALRTADGVSVRLDAGTRVRLASAKSIHLDRGAVYIDSGAGPGGMAVLAAAGLFQDIGTQFEVRIDGRGPQATTRLRVREGRVALERGDEPVVTQAGEELIVRADGDLTRRPSTAYGPDWDWVLQTAPRLDIEGVKVRTFLDWIARETGRRIEFADREAASLADSVVLHGSIEHLSLTEAPGVVLASCGLGHRIADGKLIVFVADKPH